MKKIRNKFKINRIRSPMVITCPICGFTYRIVNPQSWNKKIKCPMCGYIIIRFENKEEFNRMIKNIGDLIPNFNL